MADKEKKKKISQIDIYKAWCKACGICVAFCPMGVLGRDEGGYPYVKFLEKCINCGWCEIRCPDFAITVHAKKGEIEEIRESFEKEEEERTTAPGE